MMVRSVTPELINAFSRHICRCACDDPGLSFRRFVECWADPASSLEDLFSVLEGDETSAGRAGLRLLAIRLAHEAGGPPGVPTTDEIPFLSTSISMKPALPRGCCRLPLAFSDDDGGVPSDIAGDNGAVSKVCEIGDSAGFCGRMFEPPRLTGFENTAKGL